LSGTLSRPSWPWRLLPLQSRACLSATPSRMPPIPSTTNFQSAVRPNVRRTCRVFETCYNSIVSNTNCATLDGGPKTTCACSTASALFRYLSPNSSLVLHEFADIYTPRSCYTVACTSDKDYSKYMPAISSCQAMGLGGGAPAPTGDA